MKRHRIVRASAQAEIDHQADYLSDHASEAIANRFLAAVRETIDALVDSPGTGALWPSERAELEGIRKRRVKGFRNYLIFYRATDDALDVLHLYHAAQNIERLLEEQDSGDEDEDFDV